MTSKTIAGHRGMDGNHCVFRTRDFRPGELPRVALLRRPLDESGRTFRLATDRSSPRARLTASAEGKALAIFGSRSTRFVPLAIRRAYFPRAIFPRSSRLYSGRISSAAVESTFFIDSTLGSGRLPRTDDSDSSSAIGVGNHE
jgi:hypothetical protein